MTEIDRLIEAVEAVSETRTQVEEMAAQVFGLSTIYGDIGAAYSNISLDAALAVKNAIIPILTLSGLHEFSGMWSARLMPGEYYASATTPARALLLATLKAYQKTQ